MAENGSDQDKLGGPAGRPRQHLPGVRRAGVLLGSERGVLTLVLKAQGLTNQTSELSQQEVGFNLLKAVISNKCQAASTGVLLGN